jgi:ribonucleoside-diphosphate reductase alpha chain
MTAPGTGATRPVTRRVRLPTAMVAFSENALLVLRERYLRRDAAGNTVETPDAMLARVAAAVATAGARYGDDSAAWTARFLARMERLEFLPNSPALMNAGLPGGQLAACFVLPLGDDLDSIFSALALAARIQQTGGGTGFSFSALRPAGDRVKSTGGVSSGPLSFLDLFDHATSVIRAGGRRRGANMGVLAVDHPDIEKFIAAKLAPDRLANFNLSVGVTDAFFDAFDGGRPFALRNPRTGETVRSIDSRALFDAMVDAAWKSGDPGLIFVDEINRHNPTPALGRIEATNPCGEQPLFPYESCTLGSINLARFAAAGAADVDWNGLAGAVSDAVVFLDNLIDASEFPAPEIDSATRRTRKIGLGVMGLADLLAALGIGYDSDQATALGARLAEFLTAEARRRSAQLGERRGSFPAFADSVWPARGYRALRNATVTCVAPTGTLSLLAGCAGGIEPFFALASARRILDGRVLIDTNASVERELATLGADGQRALAEIRRHGSLRAVGGIPDALKRRYPIALEIPPLAHLRMQAAFQAHIDAAVSKTVNLASDAPVSEVRAVFLAARRFGLKGVTVYRYGSRAKQTLSFVHEERTPDCRECAV